MNKKSMILLSASLIILSGCGGESSDKSVQSRDLDSDGFLDSNDCAPEDENNWKILAYKSQDGDLDGRYIASQGEICTAGSLPEGYSVNDVVGDQIDCDDNNNEIWNPVVLHQDLDSDNVGSGEGELTCIGETLPQMTSLVTGDCDDGDALVFKTMNYEAKDFDFDGFPVLLNGELCTSGSLPDSYYSSVTQYPHLDCNDDDFSKWRMVVIYQDIDGDGVGSGQGETTCMGELASDGYSIFGYDPVDTLLDPDSFSITDFDIPASTITVMESDADPDDV